MKTHSDHDLGLVKANSSAARVKRAKRAAEAKTQVVRFWIVTMLLVLFGLSTLKLR